MSDERIKISNKSRWSGVYKGVPFEIVRWKPEYYEKNPQYDDGWKWNYYVWVKPRRVRYCNFREEKYVDYSKMYGDVEMHGGITFWSRSKGSFLKETDKIGCDYSHYHDYDGLKLRERDVDDVLRDVENTIDSMPKDLFFKA